VRAALAALSLLLTCASLQAQDTKKPMRSAPPDLQQDRAQQPRPSREHRQAEPPARPAAQVERVVPRQAERRAPDSPPSPAEQLQRQIEEKRAVDLGTADDVRVIQCQARPTCGGGYGVCNAVQQTYRAASLESSRRDIVRDCVAANSPDPCNCAAQCRAVAQCTIF